MPKSKSTAPTAAQSVRSEDSSETAACAVTLSGTCVRDRARHALTQLAEIKAQLCVLAAASQSLENGYDGLDLCHITAAIEALMAPCDKLYDDLDRLDRPQRVAGELWEQTKIMRANVAEVSHV